MTTKIDRNRRVEKWLAIGVTQLMIVLHIVHAFSAGALWRDEANTIYLAKIASFAENWARLEHDSFPMVWFFLLRAWPFSSDIGLRILPLLIGLLVTLMWWVTSRTFTAPDKRGTPLIAMTLAGLSPMVLTTGDSLRAYGLASAIAMGALCVTWRMICQPTHRRIAVTACVYILAVQTLFYNAIIIFAIGIAAAAIGVRRKSMRTLVGALSAGALAAASLLIYLPMFQGMATWNMLVKSNIILTTVLVEWPKALSQIPGVLHEGAWFGPRNWIAWVWCGLIATVFIRTLTKRGESANRDRQLFCCVAIGVLTVVYVIFLLSLSYFPWPRYYFIAVVFLAMLIDIAIQEKALLKTRYVLALILVIVTIMPAWQAARERHTNIDIVAARVAEHAEEGDLIILTPMWLGVSFRYYYRGSTPWATVPALSDHTVHRYDLAKKVMAKPTPLRPVLERVQKTLDAGQHVWLITQGLEWLAEGENPGYLPPAPLPTTGWYEGVYTVVWQRQLLHFIQTHATSAEPYDLGSTHTVSDFERLYLLKLGAQ